MLKLCVASLVPLRTSRGYIFSTSSDILCDGFWWLFMGETDYEILIKSTTFGIAAAHFCLCAYLVGTSKSYLGNACVICYWLVYVPTLWKVPLDAKTHRISNQSENRRILFATRITQFWSSNGVYGVYVFTNTLFHVYIGVYYAFKSQL